MKDPIPDDNAKWIRDNATPNRIFWGHPGYLRSGGACDSTGIHPNICPGCAIPESEHQCWHDEPIPEGIVLPPSQHWPEAQPLWIKGKLCRVRCDCRNCRHDQTISHTGGR